MVRAVGGCVKLAGMWDFIGHVLATIVFGGVGWGVTHFLAQPLIRFYERRGQAQEALFFYANLSGMTTETEHAEEAHREYRRAAARLEASAVELLPPASWFVRWRGFDLARATRGLTGLSNSVLLTDGSMTAFHRIEARKGLRLAVDPRDQAAVQAAVVAHTHRDPT